MDQRIPEATIAIGRASCNVAVHDSDAKFTDEGSAVVFKKYMKKYYF